MSYDRLLSRIFRVYNNHNPILFFKSSALHPYQPLAYPELVNRTVFRYNQICQTEIDFITRQEYGV